MRKDTRPGFRCWRSLVLTLAAVCSACAAPQETGDARRIFERGQRALAAGDLVAAEQAFKQLAGSNPPFATAYNNLGAVYLRTGKLDSAIAALKQAKRLAPGMAGVDLNLG